MTKILPLSVLLALTLTACGAASLASTSPSGGRVTLRGAYMPAMSQARLLMAERCAGHFTMHEEGKGVTFTCPTERAPAPSTLALVQR